MSTANGCDNETSVATLSAQEAVTGGLLLPSAKWHDVAAVVRDDDYAPRLRPILAAVASLAGNGEPHDVVMVADQLARMGHLEAVGGLAYLTRLALDTPTAENIAAYARAVRMHAVKNRLPEGYRDADGLGRLRRSLADYDAVQAPPTPAIALRHIADIVAERREPQWLGGLRKILERSVLAVLAGTRNAFKSFIAMHWAMTAALNGEPVVVLTAEGAGLDRRGDGWMRTHAPAVDIGGLPLVAVERALCLNSAETMAELRAAIDARGMTPALIVVDTFSKFAPGLDENDNAEVAAYLSSLSTGLRAHYDATVLLVAHAGHGDHKRPRGASVLMANPDAEYIVERPDPLAMTATVTRERFKDSPALTPLAYAAEVVDLGRQDGYGEPVTSLVMRDTDAYAVVSARKPELRGKAQRQLLAALRAQAADGAGIWTLADMREVGRKAGLGKPTARSAAEVLATSPFMKPAVGGWMLADA